MARQALLVGRSAGPEETAMEVLARFGFTKLHKVETVDDYVFPDPTPDPEAIVSDSRGRIFVAGGTGPITAVCHGWNETSHAVHGTYEA